PHIRSRNRHVDSTADVFAASQRVVASGSGVVCFGGVCVAASTALAQGVTGTVRDQTGGVLPGVTVEAHTAGAATKTTVTNTAGTYTLDLPAGQYEVSYSLVNFAVVKRQIEVTDGRTPTTVDITLRFVLNADVTVTGKRTFTNLADAEAPAE